MSEAKKDDNNDGNNSEDPQGNAAEGILYNQNKCIWVGQHEQLFEDFEDKTFALSLKSNFFAEGSASLDLHC